MPKAEEKAPKNTGGNIAGSTGFGKCRDVSDFDKLDQLGEGTYGKVFLARDRRSGDIVALKQVRMEHEKEGFPVTALREIQLLYKLQHENVVSLLDIAAGKKKESIFLVFEYCQHDLATLMEKMSAPFSKAQVKNIMQQVLSAVAVMHDEWIVHRDMKMSNLLYNNSGQVKLADLGLARTVGHSLEKLTPNVVTLWYRAPELLLGSKNYESGVDMWAMGCIFAELLSHRVAMPGRSGLHQLELIFGLVGTPTERIWPGYASLPAVKDGYRFKLQPYNRLRDKFPSISDQALSLLNGLLTLNPENRLTAQQALEHEYFKEAPAPLPTSMMPTYPEFRGKRPLELKARAAQSIHAPAHSTATNKRGAKPSSLSSAVLNNLF